MSNDILDLFNNISLADNIIWQYDNAPAIKGLIQSKQNWYDTNNSGFWQSVVDNFLNIHTANDWGLELWGKILKVARIYNISGQTVTLSTELYRRLILGKLQLIHSNGTLPEMMNYCNFVFSDHITELSYAVLVIDNHDMSVTYTFNFQPNQEELALIYSRDFFPTPAGVDIAHIYIVDGTNYFGFDGSPFKPFDTYPYWNGQIII